MSRGVAIAAVVAATLGSAIGALVVVTLRADGVREADPAVRTLAIASTEVTAEAASAEREGEALVDQALARRAWTDDDAREMRRLLRGVTPEQRDQILRRLVPAMNDHRIAFQGHGAPL